MWVLQERQELVQLVSMNGHDPVSTSSSGACLYLWPGSPAGELAIRRALEGAFELRRSSSAWVFSGSREGVRRALEQLRSAVSEGERKGTRALLVPGCTGIGTDAIPLVRTLDELLREHLEDSAFRVLNEQRLVIHFQPIVDASFPQRVFGWEALLRIPTEEGTAESPAEVIRSARMQGLTMRLNLTIVSTAVAEAVRLGLEGLLFLNLDPAVLVESLLPAEVMEAIVMEAGMAPGRIVLELLETLAAPDEEVLKSILEPYRRVGFRIALDDLGAGHSSLNLMHMVRPDLVKLDMAMVRGLDTDRYKATLVGHLIELAHGLGAAVVVEGIETRPELEWIQAQRADYAQGWLIARPANPPALPDPSL